MLQATFDPLSAKAAKAADSRNSDLGQKDIFLKLLVAQMKFQDPLKPQDPTKMSSQLAQFNTLEAQLNSNKLLQQLVDVKTTGSTNNASPASYLGKTATIPIDTLQYGGGSQTFDVGLLKDSKQVLAVISDSNGTPIRSLDLGALVAGAHPATWDGKDDLGNAMSAGDYNIKVVAADITGTPIDAQAQQSGQVTAVRFTPSGGSQVIVNGNAVDLSKISQISL